MAAHERATMEQSKATFPLECFSYSFLLFPTLSFSWVPFLPPRAKAYKGGNLAKLWSISSGRGAIFIYGRFNVGEILHVINFKVYKVWPQFQVGQIYCQHPLWKLFNEIRLDCFLEKQWKLNQIEKFNFCQRPDSTPNVLLPRLVRSLIGPKSAVIILIMSKKSN